MGDFKGSRTGVGFNISPEDIASMALKLWRNVTKTRCKLPRFDQVTEWKVYLLRSKNLLKHYSMLFESVETGESFVVHLVVVGRKVKPLVKCIDPSKRLYLVNEELGVITQSPEGIVCKSLELLKDFGDYHEATNNCQHYVQGLAEQLGCDVPWSDLGRIAQGAAAGAFVGGAVGYVVGKVSDKVVGDFVGVDTGESGKCAGTGAGIGSGIGGAVGLIGGPVGVAVGSAVGGGIGGSIGCSVSKRRCTETLFAGGFGGALGGACGGMIGYYLAIGTTLATGVGAGIGGAIFAGVAGAIGGAAAGKK